MVSSVILYTIHPRPSHPIPPTKEAPLLFHTLKRTSSILVVWLMIPHVPIMANAITNRRMRGSLCGIPIYRGITVRSRVAILVDGQLSSSDSRGIGSVALTHISGRGVGGEDIGVLVSVGLVVL